jgi:hypothetical protein
MLNVSALPLSTQYSLLSFRCGAMRRLIDALQIYYSSLRGACDEVISNLYDDLSTGAIIWSVYSNLRDFSHANQVL